MTTLTAKERYNVFGLPTEGFLKALKAAPVDDPDFEDYLEGRWHRNLPLTPDASDPAITAAVILPTQTIEQKIIVPLNGHLWRAIDAGGDRAACEPLLHAIRYPSDDYEDHKYTWPAGYKKQKRQLQRWLTHTLMVELHQLPGITPGDLWHTLNNAAPEDCPIFFSLYHRSLPQETHDRLWQGIDFWRKPTRWDDDEDELTMMTGNVIHPGDMIQRALHPSSHAPARAAALHKMAAFMEKNPRWCSPELYHAVQGFAANANGIVRTRAEAMLPALETARQLDIADAENHLHKTIHRWDPPTPA